MRERGKPYGKTDSCYVTEMNGKLSTGIIDITQHNHFITQHSHFLDLIEHVAKRKNNKAKSNNSTTGNHASALSSYPTDMIHAGMNPQQAVDAFAGLVLNDATPEKVMSLEGIGSEIIERSVALGIESVVDDVTKIRVELHIDSDGRYGAQLFTSSNSNHNIENKQSEHSLSEASAKVLEMYRNKNFSYIV